MAGDGWDCDGFFDALEKQRKPLPSQEVMKIRAEHQCSIQEAYKIFRRQQMVDQITAATSIEELKVCLLRVMDMIK